MDSKSAEIWSCAAKLVASVIWRDTIYITADRKYSTFPPGRMDAVVQAIQDSLGFCKWNALEEILTATQKNFWQIMADLYSWWIYENT